MTLETKLDGLDRMIWVDTETFGLNPKEDPVIEIGFKITDIELNTIDDIAVQIWDIPEFDKLYEVYEKSTDKVETIVFDMHTKSGLWVKARENGRTPADASNKLVDWLDSHGVDRSEPLCGSTVHFDRAMLRYQYKEVHDMFSYRNIDVSTLKELCMRYNPNVFNGLAGTLTPAKKHRVLDDLNDTINEFNFYKDNFLFI